LKLSLLISWASQKSTAAFVSFCIFSLNNHPKRVSSEETASRCRFNFIRGHNSTDNDRVAITDKTFDSTSLFLIEDCLALHSDNRGYHYLLLFPWKFSFIGNFRRYFQLQQASLKETVAVKYPMPELYTELQRLLNNSFDALHSHDLVQKLIFQYR